MKKFLYKVYNKSNNLWDVMTWDVDNWDYMYQLITVWKDEVTNEPTWREVINGSASELTIRLARRFNDFGEGEDVELNNRVDLYIYDEDEPQGKLMYRGFISAYAPTIEGKQEYVEVTLLGIGQDTNNYILQDSTGNTTVAYVSQDPSDIIRDIIDKYSVQGGSVRYTDSSIQDTGTTVTYAFSVSKVNDALDKVVNLAPDGWSYIIKADGIIYFEQTSNTADHKLTTGKDIATFSARKTAEQLVNEVYFIGGTPAGEEQLFKKYTSSSSSGTYGVRAVKEIDQRVTNASTAETFANRKLDGFSSPITRATITVLDSNTTSKGYDIDSIKPGDSLQITNLQYSKASISKWDVFQWDADVWDQTLSNTLAEVLQVTSVIWNMDNVSIEVADRLPEVAKRIEDINRNLETNVTQDIPIQPTT